MEQKNNKTIWYIAALVLLLCVGTLIVSTGSSFARYQKNKDFTLNYSVKPREQVYMGTVSSEGDFTRTEELEWTAAEGSSKRLTIAVANAAEKTGTVFPQEDKEITLRLLGSAGFYDAEPKLILMNENGEEISVSAEKRIIEKNTALYISVGEGVIFEFFDENGEEIFWTLEGGKFSVQQIVIEADFSKILTDTLIQPQISVK